MRREIYLSLESTMDRRVTVWLVRDSDAFGVLLPYVTIWRVRPDRVAVGRGHYWRSDAGWVESIWPEECARRYRVVPDDDLQCIRVGA